MASAADLAALLPSCAIPCLLSAIANSTCAPTDQACTCSDEKLNTQATACIVSACTPPEALGAKNGTAFLCGIEPNVNDTYVPIMIVFICLAAFVVLMRLSARLFMDLPLWWDDWANFSAMAVCIVYTVYGLTLKSGGLGTDLWAIPVDGITDQFIGYWVLIVLYIAARVLIRISIVLFYMRIFRSSQATRLVRGTLISTLVISVPIIIAGIVQCNPVSYFWTRWDGEHTGRCINAKAFLWAAWIIHILNDFWLMTVPLPLIAKLQLSLRKKLLISVMFCMGILVVAVTIYKLTLIDSWTRLTNPSYDQVPMMIWAAVEVDLGVICACMPSLPVLFRPAIQRFKEATSKGSPDASGYSGSGSRSRYGVLGGQGKRSTFSPAVARVRGRGGDGDIDTIDNNHIKMVTTIHQANERSESETYLPLRGANAGDLETLNQGHLRVQAWS
ncbi:hypothetical protein F5B20DRAFT_520502 [Whalleya microplaca]|nr:hypothetical protein F5B20DRAFT_520502 [Whalleya microplaca]